MKRQVLLFFLFLFAIKIFAQDFKQSNYLSSSSYLFPVDNVFSSQENIVLSDFFGSLNLTESYTATYRDVFIAKFNTDYSIDWLTHFEGDSIEFSTGLASDDSTFAFLINYRKNLNFATKNLSSQGDYDVAVVKYDFNGNEKWVKNIAVNPSSQIGRDIDYDESGNIIIAGEYSDSITIGSEKYINDFGFFVIKLDPFGNIIWSKDIPSTDDNEIGDIKAFKDGYYINGRFKGTVNFDVGDEVSTSSSYKDLFLYKIGTDKSGLWVRRSYGVSEAYSGTISRDQYGNIYYTGRFTGSTISFDSTLNEVSSEIENVNSATADIFVSKYNKTGSLIWKRRYGSEGNDWAQSINYQNDFLYLTGFFAGELIFGQDTIQTTGTSDKDIFLGLIDENGNELRAISIYGGEARTDAGVNVEFDEENNGHLLGYFSSTNIQVGDSSYTNPNPGNRCLLLAKYHPPFSATFSKKQDVTCNGGSDGELIATHYFGVPPFTYDWSHDAGLNDSIATGLTAGDYQVIISDDAGSKDTLNYTVTQPDPFVFDPAITHVTTCSDSEEGAITLNMSGGNGGNDYLWDASEGGYGVVLTAKDQTGLTPGRYDVSVTDDQGCTADTTMYITGPPAMSFENSIVTNDNGALDNGAIDLEISGGTGAPGSYDASWTGPSGYSNNVQDISNLDAGDYHVTVTDDNGCTADTTFNVLDEQALYAYISESKDACQVPADNGSATVEYYTPLGDPEVTYQWDANAGGQTTATATGLAPNTYSVTVTDIDNSQTSVATVTINQLAYTIDGTLTGTSQLDCYGDTDGYVDLNMTTEGTKPYSYEWTTGATSQDISGLGIGSYNVTVTDANACTYTPATAFDIAEPEQLVADIGIRDEISCFGEYDGAIEVTGTTGGNGGYNYLWNDPGSQTTTIADGLDDGFYHVSVTDSKGCQYVTNDIHLIEPDEIVIAETAYDISCNGLNDGAILLDVSGGTTPFDYFWTTEDGSGLSATTKNQSDLGPGTYNVIATDANLCETTLDVVINEPTAISIDSESKTDIEGCFGDATGEIEVAASGGTGSLSYTLTPGDVENSTGTFGSLAAGNYSVAIRDANSCEVTTALEITQPTELAIAETSTADESAAGAGDGSVSATAEGGTSPYTYTLSPGGAENQTGVFENLDAGTYTITITDARGCGNLETSDLVVGSRTGFDDINGGKLYVFPNPASSNLTVQWESELGGSFMIELISLTGEVHAYKKVEKTGNRKQTSFAVEDLARGIYLLRITDENGQSHQKKIVLK